MTAPQDPFRTPDEGTGDAPGYGSTPSYGAPAEGTGAPGYGSTPSYGAPAEGTGAPAFGAPAYGAPAYGAPVGGPPRNGMGVAALVLGILALITSVTVIGGLLFGVLAIVFGVIGRGRVKRREADNGGLATAGIVLGALGLLASVALIALGASLLNSDSGKAYQDCLEEAGDDRAAIQQCAVDFSEDVTS